MKKVIIVLLVALVIIQFFQIDKNNPEPTPQLDFLKIKDTPEKISTTLRTSCYDCHSNETVYPWYSNIQPFGWFLKSHIDEGRRKLNFSTFATYDKKRQTRKLEESVEMIENGEMPLDSYTIIHSEAKISANQQQDLIAYLKMVKQDIERAHEISNGVEPSDFKEIEQK